MAGIYIHIPFCKKRCYYCNFYSIVTLRNKDEFLAAIIKEAALQKDYLNNETIETIYFGGGTPSLLEISELSRIIENLFKNFKISDKAEWTIEANPDDISATYLYELKKIGINRFSLGVQSFFDDDLKYLNRIHSAKQSEIAIELIKENGFDNYSIDLIYGIPGLDRGKWVQNLERVNFYDVPHLSAYALTVEPQTPMKKLIEKGRLKPVSEDKTVEHLKMLVEWAEKNAYEHYEISNFAKPNFRSKHNSSYWFDKKYLGLGPSSHSYNFESRQWNVASITKYIKLISEGKIPFELEILSENQKFNEYILTRLRTLEGISLEEVMNKFNQKYLSHLEKRIPKYLFSKHLIAFENNVRLSKDGILLADQISSDLFVE